MAGFQLLIAGWSGLFFWRNRRLGGWPAQIGRAPRKQGAPVRCFARRKWT